MSKGVRRLSPDSFVFSLKNGQDMQNMKISRIDSIFDYLDLYIDGTNLNFGLGFYNSIFDANLPIEEIEVFNVVKR